MPAVKRKTKRMTKTFTGAVVLSMALAGFAGTTSAQTPLKDVAFVREGIIATGMAFEISENCSSLSPRRIRGINYLFSLRKHAFGLGYTGAQVDAYVDDKAEENRLKQIAYGRLFDLGAVSGDGVSYCMVGRAEMAKGSQIGRLLR